MKSTPIRLSKNLSDEALFCLKGKESIAPRLETNECSMLISFLLQGVSLLLQARDRLVGIKGEQCPRISESDRGLFLSANNTSLIIREHNDNSE